MTSTTCCVRYDELVRAYKGDDAFTEASLDEPDILDAFKQGVILYAPPQALRDFALSTVVIVVSASTLASGVFAAITAVRSGTYGAPLAQRLPQAP